jgi:SpoVK/Ycf46/Vps4 family AAA+-type ATPase
VSDRLKESVTEYALRYLNTAGRFGATQVLEALARKPRGTLCFYGMPGTGKTQFAEYLSQQLGIPLIARRASELLSKWLGETERNIAAMFEEAASEDAMILLDEGDLFLQDRSKAEKSWEITQVNELLQRMERFDGIFVLCTNLFQDLDAAALRRFTFKILFQPLNNAQRWEMFVGESGLKGKLGALDRKTRDDWERRLSAMTDLCAGDFATVKRQAVLLNQTLSAAEWIEQLQIEVDTKNTATRPRAAVGFT